MFQILFHTVFSRSCLTLSYLEHILYRCFQILLIMVIFPTLFVKNSLDLIYDRLDLVYPSLDFIYQGLVQTQFYYVFSRSYLGTSIMSYIYRSSLPSSRSYYSTVTRSYLPPSFVDLVMGTRLNILSSKATKRCWLSI